MSRKLLRAGKLMLPVGNNFSTSSVIDNPAHEFLLKRPIVANEIGNSNFIFKLESLGEKLRFRDAWTQNVVRVVDDRLQRPRFSFPGVFDRAAPPPKTLHWRHAPKIGEYNKMKAMLSWATLHVWLLSGRLRGTQYHFLVSHCFDHLYNRLTGVWLPEASIPAFSIKSEAKMILDECRETETLLSSCNCVSSIQSLIWARSLAHCNIPESDPVLSDLLEYLCVQKTLLENLSARAIVESAWQWKD